LAEEIIVLRNVWKIYRMGKVLVQALKGINLRVRRGESICIMGPSGSGKTTLLNIIATIDKPTKGEVFVCGENVTEMSETQLAKFRLKNIGIVFQFYNLLPELNALENVMLPLLLTGIPRSRAHDIALNLLNKVGLGSKANHKPAELSGGEQQRVAIASAIANNPKIILADEPTGNLDLESKKQVLELFRELNMSEGITMIIVSHDPLVSKYTRKTIHLVDGKIV